MAENDGGYLICESQNHRYETQMDSPAPHNSQTTNDGDNSPEDAYEAGYEAAKQVPIESVSEALDFSCGYFDCLRERLMGEG